MLDLQKQLGRYGTGSPCLLEIFFFYFCSLSSFQFSSTSFAVQTSILIDLKNKALHILFWEGSSVKFSNEYCLGMVGLEWVLLREHLFKQMGECERILSQTKT